MKYLYVLKDPFDKKVRYVGATKNPKSRFYQHIKDAKKKKKTAKTKKQKWISGLLERGLQPLIEVIKKIDDDAEARREEEKLVIKHIETVYNLHMPGKGSLSVDCFKKNKRKWDDHQKSSNKIF